MEGELHSASLLPAAAAAAKIESLTCPEALPNPRKKNKKKNKHKNKTRFSDEQIRSLESMFQSETKLEPRKKLQMARELGLQPRQVAIWFQNRRARWKSKQIEQNYRILQTNYDNLHSRFESLKTDKQSLLIQLKKLSDLLEKTHDLGSRSKDLRGNSTSGELKTKQNCLVAYSDDDEGGNAEYFRQEEEAELLKICGQVDDGSLALPEKWYNFNSIGLFDQSCGSSSWWDFWT